MIEVIKYNPKLKKDWDNFVKESKNYHFMFYRDYMEYHSDRFEDYSLMFFYKGKLAGLLPANKKNKILYSHGGLTFGGLISNSKMTTPLMLEIFKELISFLKKNEFKELLYKAIPYIYHLMPAEEDRYALFVNNAELYKREISSTIYLDKLSPFPERRKSGIRKAKKSGFNVEESKDFKTYMDIVSNLLKEKYGSKPVHSYEEIRYLAEKFPDNIKLFVANDKNRTMQAGIIIYENPEIAHTQYIASTEEGRKAGAVDLILDYLINEYYKDKKYFDFGTSNINEGKNINEGLISFKESFGASGVVHDFYRIIIE